MQLTEEHKAKMKAGRDRASAERKAKGIKRASRGSRAAPEPRLPASPAAPAPAKAPREFLGITRTDCPVDCTAEHCVITGVGFCGHPCKGALQPVYMSNRETVDRYNRARKHLAHVELDKRP